MSYVPWPVLVLLKNSTNFESVLVGQKEKPKWKRKRGVCKSYFPGEFCVLVFVLADRKGRPYLVKFVSGNRGNEIFI